MIFLKSNSIIITAILIYSICGIFNNGYYYYDEHYQIVEFAEFIAGNNKPSDLAWEYGAMIRPAIQPGIVYLVFSFMKWMSVKDPYFLAMVLRLLSGLLAITCISYFVKKTTHLINHKLKVWYEIISYFLWFLPFVNVRFSSESWAGLTFILGIAFIFSNLKHKHVLVGCFIGLSFLLRFQTAFMSIGFVLWLIFIKKIDKKSFYKIFFGAFLIIFFGCVIDYWFYKTVTVTFINYYIFNIIHDVASRYGVAPWYFYFLQSIKSAILPLGIVIWIFAVIQLITNRRSFICWVMIPFLLIHIITPHKELRFLFPLVNLIPLTIILSIQQFRQIDFFKIKWLNRIIVIVSLSLLIINFSGLFVIMFSPADGVGRMSITQTIHDNYKNKKVVLWTFDTNNPYKPLPLNQKFYFDKNVSVKTLNLSDTNLFLSNVTNLIVIKASLLNEHKHMLLKYKAEKIRSGVPDWILNIRAITGYNNKSLYLYESKWLTNKAL
jgi:phosphatidylinositol glycan class B